MAAIEGKNGTAFDSTLCQLLEEEFAFLQSDYGCRRLKLFDGYRHENERTVIYVRSLYDGPWVGLDSRVAPYEIANYGIPIWIVMRTRGSRFLYDARDRLDKFAVYADALRECADDLLRGDFSSVGEVIARLKERNAAGEAWVRNLHLEGSLAKADDAFARGNFAECSRVLSRIESELSPAYRKKLNYARKRA